MTIEDLPSTFEEFNQSFFPTGIATKDQLEKTLSILRLAYRKYPGHEDTIALKARGIKAALNHKDTLRDQIERHLL